MPLVPINAMISDIQDFGKIPVRAGRNVYIRDVATISDATDINFGYALVNGQRSIYIPVVKKNTASTLTVVDRHPQEHGRLQKRAARVGRHQLRVRRIADRARGDHAASPPKGSSAPR